MKLYLIQAYFLRLSQVGGKVQAKTNAEAITKFMDLLTEEQKGDIASVKIMGALPMN